MTKRADIEIEGPSSPAILPLRRRYAGAALLWIAGIHTLLGVLIGLRWLPDPQMDSLAGDRVPLLEIYPGFAESADAVTLTMFWFVFFGFALGLVGSAIRHLEMAMGFVPRSLGFQTAAMCLAGGILMPVSGFWLGLVPAYNIVLRGRSTPAS